MSPLEIGVIVACAAIGYKYVSSMMDKRGASSTERPRSTDEPRLGDAPAAWHHVLGVAPDATHEQIVAAYRQQISQYHPDKVASLGDDLRTFAEARTKAINAAYAEALAKRPS